MAQRRLAQASDHRGIDARLRRSAHFADPLLVERELNCPGSAGLALLLQQQLVQHSNQPSSIADEILCGRVRAKLILGLIETKRVELEALGRVDGTLLRSGRRI